VCVFVCFLRWRERGFPAASNRVCMRECSAAFVFLVSSAVFVCFVSVIEPCRVRPSGCGGVGPWPTGKQLAAPQWTHHPNPPLPFLSALFNTANTSSLALRASISWGRGQHKTRVGKNRGGGGRCLLWQRCVLHAVVLAAHINKAAGSNNAREGVLSHAGNVRGCSRSSGRRAAPPQFQAFRLDANTVASSRGEDNPPAARPLRPRLASTSTPNGWGEGGGVTCNAPLEVVVEEVAVERGLHHARDPYDPVRVAAGGGETDAGARRRCSNSAGSQCTSLHAPERPRVQRERVLRRRAHRNQHHTHARRSRAGRGEGGRGRAHGVARHGPRTHPGYFMAL
jgi:hypothetical protein